MKQNERPATKEVVESTIEQLQAKIDYLAEKRLEIKYQLPKLEQLRRENKEPVGSPLRDAIDAQYNRKVQRYQNIPSQIAKYSDRIQTLQIILKTFEQ